MLFFNKKEINYELYYKQLIIRLLVNKENKNNKYLFSFKPIIKLFFWFKKIKEEDLDFLKLFNHLILLWLITGQVAYLKNLKSNLNKGIRYYRFIYSLEIHNIFFILNFLNEILLPVIQNNSKKIHYKNLNKFLCSFKDLGIFTNLRLSSNLYLNSVHDKLFVFIKLGSSLNLIYYLNSLKILI